MSPYQWEGLARGENEMGEALKSGSSLTRFGSELTQVQDWDTSKEFMVIRAKYILTHLCSDGVANDPRE
jgi:hypothetical protein